MVDSPFTVFTTISDRNIFDPNRNPETPPPTVEPSPVLDAFALVGVIRYEKGPMAFFDGTSSQFKKAVRPGEQIDGFTVTTIADNNVRLNAGVKELELHFGMQVRRENQGEWRLSVLSKPFTPAFAPTKGRN